MTGPSLLNGTHRPQVCLFAGRRADETLHAFLLRRHQEMGDEITAFEAITERQASMLWVEREARIALVRLPSAFRQALGRISKWRRR
ncbi:hypothetical protein KFK14_09960 [Sphingobium phenoxybenzoativorans]|jgi:hypothetical protein|uniref:Uncharacterized protein n=1 Tax=Sphingobium phenoxybenzoativorans TaxID=1592790 RepID=A0A975Q3F1_9SPHN|nr:MULTISPECIES: hypothetical protein [Sphingobium]QUT07676.1 hypothetical protein KFK14_09960 [Sphingobium phenoxybenzoativorans]